ncbi:hypothetical protein NU09_1520 [Flavobacterium beibuense]|uniref:Uncharacterized protein n=1 Tax=Flavobacterium beibuense TaxID=657326 RepID=A0A444WBK3_9FLAO|nr:hypothetical protein NU09_1520 [Flavobacterium beibuense]
MLSCKQNSAVKEGSSVTDKATKPVFSDTTHIDYLRFLLTNDKKVNPYWEAKLKTVGVEMFPQNNTEIILDNYWSLNEKTQVLIIKVNSGNSSDSYLITSNNNTDFMAMLHISHKYKRNLNNDFYSYREYEIMGGNRVELTVREFFTEEKIETIKKEKWYVRYDGMIEREDYHLVRDNLYKDTLESLYFKCLDKSQKTSSTVRYLDVVYSEDFGLEGIKKMSEVIDEQSFRHVMEDTFADKNHIYKFNLMIDGGTLEIIE